MINKDIHYYKSIVEGLEEVIKQQDLSTSRYREENRRLRLSKAYRLSLKLSQGYKKARSSIVGQTYRTIKKTYKYSLTKLRFTSHNIRSVETLILNEYNTQLRLESSKSRIGIILIARDGAIRPQSSAFIRLIAPLTSKKLKNKINLQIYDEKLPAAVYDRKITQLFIVQRSAFSTLEIAMAFFEKTKQINAKLIIDLDDALSLLDQNHEQYQIQHKSLEALDFLIQKCDQLWCSTKVILDSYEHLAPRVHLIENTINTTNDTNDFQVNRDSNSVAQPVQILYMGTSTHYHDFAMISPALDRIHAILPGSFEVTIIGVAKNIAERPYIKFLSPPQELTVYPLFIKWLSQYKNYFDIGISPLVETPFNMAKSDIKCIDYLSVGAIPVVSNVSPYAKSALGNYVMLVDNNTEAWTDCLIKLIIDHKLLVKQRSIAKNGYSYVLKNRLTDQSSELILRLINSLF